VLCPVIERYRGLDIERSFRGDAAFGLPGLMCELEAEEFWYAIRIKENPVLMRAVEHLTSKRPVGRPSYRPKVLYRSFMYQAGSWDRERRIVAKVEWHWDELLPRVGFIVTNLRWRPKRVVKFYNGRGTAEQWIKEGKNAVRWTKLSCRDFKDNHVRLQLFALAYNLGNFLRRLELPRSVAHWSLTTLREKLIKIGAKAVAHARYVTWQMAEVAVPKEPCREDAMGTIRSDRAAEAAQAESSRKSRSCSLAETRWQRGRTWRSVTTFRVEGGNARMFF
jgi:hypothetical protein